MLALLVFVTSAHADVTSEPIGPLRLGMTEAKVAKAAGAPSTKQKPTFAGEATSDWEKVWIYPGVVVTFYADTEKGPTWRIRSIEVAANSAWKTKRGIGIGASRARVKKAYARLEDKQAPSEGKFVAGSVYGGVIFTFADDKVADIFVGAAAF